MSLARSTRGVTIEGKVSGVVRRLFEGLRGGGAQAPRP
jgi:hypothetical protein